MVMGVAGADHGVGVPTAATGEDYAKGSSANAEGHAPDHNANNDQDRSRAQRCHEDVNVSVSDLGGGVESGLSGGARTAARRDAQNTSQ